VLCVQRPPGLAPFLISSPAVATAGRARRRSPRAPIQRIGPWTDSLAGEAALYLDLEVRTRAGTSYSDALVTWDLSHSAILASPLADERGELQAVDFHPGRRAELQARATAHRTA